MPQLEVSLKLKPKNSSKCHKSLMQYMLWLWQDLDGKAEQHSHTTQFSARKPFFFLTFKPTHTLSKTQILTINFTVSFYWIKNNFTRSNLCSHFILSWNIVILLFLLCGSNSQTTFYSWKVTKYIWTEKQSKLISLTWISASTVASKIVFWC